MIFPDGLEADRTANPAIGHRLHLVHIEDPPLSPDELGWGPVGQTLIQLPQKMQGCFPARI